MSAIVISQVYDVKINSVKKEFIFTVEHVKSEIDKYLSPISSSLHVTSPIITQMIHRREDNNASILTNEAERSHLFSIFDSYLKASLDIEMLYFGDTQGHFILRIRDNDQTFSNKIVLNQEGKIHTTWEHFDNKGSLLSTETQVDDIKDGYDPRKRSWFQQAMNTPLKGIWSDVYDFYTTKEKGMTYSIPIYYKGRFVGVIGADIGISQLNRLLRKSLPKSVVGDFSTHLFLVYNDKLIGDSWGNIFIGQTVSRDSSMGQFYLDDKETLDQITEPTLKASNEIAPYYGYFSTYNTYVGSDQNFYIGFISPKSTLFRSAKNTVFILICIILLATILIAWASMATINKLTLPLMQIEGSLQNLINLKFVNNERQNTFFKEINIINEAIQGLENALLSFSKFVPDVIMNHSIKKNEVISNFVDKKRLVVMFSDIEGFTTISENADTRELLENIEQYFSICMDTIHNYEGIVDKTIGDGIMSLWNTPNDIDDFEYKSCLAAIEIQKNIEQLNKKFETTKFPRFNTRIGIHVDNVLVGAIGHKDRLNYTAMGSGVNIASRIEAANTKVVANIQHNNILISESVYLCVKDRLICHYAGQFALKGIQEEMPLYSLPIQDVGHREEI